METMQQLSVNGVSLENIPVMIQPGQAPGSIGLALGYGRKTNLKEEMQVGVNAIHFIQKLIMFNMMFLLKKHLELFMSLLVHKYKKQLQVDMIF